MKKLLLLSLFTINFASQAQVLVNEPMTSLTIGNVGSDLTGTTPGQGGWTTLVATTAVPAGQNSDFQVVDKGGVYGKAFQVTGASSASGTRWLMKDVSAAWAGRTPGNNIAEVEFDLFTGPVSTSKNTQRMVFYESAAKLKMLAGLMLTMDTKEIRALAYIDPVTLGGTGAIGNYSLTLGGTPAVPAALILLPDTWYHFGMSFNKTTGEIIFKETTMFDRTFSGAATNENVGELDILATAGTANTVASTVAYDNIAARSSATGTLLGVISNQMDVNAIAIYPNPARNSVTISGRNLSLNRVEMTDVNGRVVKNSNLNGVNESQIDISGLASGLYLVKINSSEGTVTKKLVKE